MHILIIQDDNHQTIGEVAVFSNDTTVATYFDRERCVLVYDSKASFFDDLPINHTAFPEPAGELAVDLDDLANDYEEGEDSKNFAEVLRGLARQASAHRRE